MSSLYGSYYRTRKFSEIFESAEDFIADYIDNGIPATIDVADAQTLYYLLYSNYGNSNIASSDENRFKYSLFAIIYEYGKIWVKRRAIQDVLLGLEDEDITKTSQTILNHAFAPGEITSSKSTESGDILNYVNEQNVSKGKTSKIMAYSSYYEVLDDYTEVFLYKFKKLFITVVQPENPLWYETNTNDEGE